VFVLGDSLSAGLDPDGVAWPTRLADTTARKVRNLAHPGSRLRDGLRQAEQLPPGPSVVVIELGGNDILSGTTPPRFEEALRALLNSAASDPERIVWMFELPLLPLQNRYGLVQRRLSAELGVTLIPRRVLAGAVALPGHTTDGLHLSPAGHDWLARTLARWL
jgi:lysophospholipase L1-like esterase